MKKLPADFELDRYGLHCRLVREEDAEFIVSLRTNPVKSKFLSTTSNDIAAQQSWIKKYKEREINGVDYYLMYEYKGKKAGVNRLYEIDDNHFIHGSWLFANNVPPYCALAAAVIAREIAYDMLELDIEIDTAGIHKDNVDVLQFARYMGCEFDGSVIRHGEEFLTSHLTKEIFENNKHKILKLFPRRVM